GGGLVAAAREHRRGSSAAGPPTHGTPPAARTVPTSPEGRHPESVHPPTYGEMCDRCHTATDWLVRQDVRHGGRSPKPRPPARGGGRDLVRGPLRALGARQLAGDGDRPHARPGRLG